MEKEYGKQISHNTRLTKLLNISNNYKLKKEQK